MYFFRNYFIPQLCVSLNFAFCYTRISLLQLHEMKTKNCFLLFFVLLIERNRKRGKTFNRQSFSLYWQMWKSCLVLKSCVQDFGSFLWIPNSTTQENVCHAKQPLAKSGPHFTYTEPRGSCNYFSSFVFVIYGTQAKRAPLVLGNRGGVVISFFECKKS